MSRALKRGKIDMSGVRGTYMVDEKYHKTLIFTPERERIVGRS
jgi:hypothetical protein